MTDNPLVPVITEETAPFWEAVASQRLVLPRCSACGQFWYPPGGVCPECWSQRWRWEAVAGTGTLYSWAIYRRAYHPALEGRLPYVVAVAALSEGPHFLSVLVDSDGSDCAVGRPVVIDFRRLWGESWLPVIRFP
jgi:uncharacterized OB-fold protein